MARSSGYMKGITIEIGGDVTKPGDALDATGRKSSVTASDLLEVETSLKFNAGNVELLAQKQMHVGEQAENLREKLGHLKRALGRGWLFADLRQFRTRPRRSLEPEPRRPCTPVAPAVECGRSASRGAHRR